MRPRAASSCRARHRENQDDPCRRSGLRAAYRGSCCDEVGTPLTGQRLHGVSGKSSHDGRAGMRRHELEANSANNLSPSVHRLLSVVAKVSACAANTREESWSARKPPLMVVPTSMNAALCMENESVVGALLG